MHQFRTSCRAAVCIERGVLIDPRVVRARVAGTKARGEGSARIEPVNTVWPIVAKGFRPFFLLAGLFATLVVPLWLLVIDGTVQVSTYLDPINWHAHEMVFGFAAAVIAGFLLTAVGNWTKRETAIGFPLLGLAALWIAGRILITASSPFPPWLVAVVDLSFLPALAIVIARSLIATRNHKNLVMVAILAALFVANLMIHLDALGVLPGWRRRGDLMGVDVLVLVILVIAGRVLPMFTRNATGVESIASSPRLDRLVLGAMAIYVVLDLLIPSLAITPSWGLLVAVLAVARSWRWGARYSLRTPLLWVLHLGYLWIPIGLALRAVAAVTPLVSPQIATHALTIGAVGTLTLGMMARVALGHSGRMLVAARPIALAFALALLAGLVRVAGAAVGIEAYRSTLIAAGLVWTAAFSLYLVVYAPILVSARSDGKPG
jgi:uncharacterized protein involved in response to NO